MIKKNKKSTHYIDSPLNRSPSKQVHKFSQAERFTPQKKFSPDRFYDLPSTFDKRAPSFGYGNKVDFVLRQLNDPGRIVLRTQFDEIAQGYRYGVRPPARQTPKREYSYSQLPKNRDYSFNNKQTYEPRTSSKSKKSSHTKEFQKSNNDFHQKNRSRTIYDDQNESNRVRKSAKQLKYQYAERSILHNDRISYTQFLNSNKKTPEKPIQRQTRQHQNRSLYGLEERIVPENNKQYFQHSTFGKGDRIVQRQKLPSTLGPGKYNAFSEFGNNTPF